MLLLVVVFSQIKVIRLRALKSQEQLNLIAPHLEQTSLLLSVESASTQRFIVMIQDRSFRVIFMKWLSVEKSFKQSSGLNAGPHGVKIRMSVQYSPQHRENVKTVELILLHESNEPCQGCHRFNSSLGQHSLYFYLVHKAKRAKKLNAQ